MLIPEVKSYSFLGEEWSFSNKLVLNVSSKVYNAKNFKLLKELFKNFTSNLVKLKIVVTSSEFYSFSLSKTLESLDAKALNGNDYILDITETGAKGYFSNYSSFCHAFFTLLQLIEIRNGEKHKELLTLPITHIEDKPKTQIRMVHVCVFRESSFLEILKAVRQSGFYKYSHIVLEFWGTFRYKCNKNLWGSGAFTCAQVKRLVFEAKAMGLEVIPMINMWGHAPMQRVFCGKHVTLDNNPKLAPYFSVTGWEWNFLNEKVKTLHKQMINELINALGEGEYFHIGCDEAYSFGDGREYYGKDKTQIICNYINDINEFIKSKGRKTLMWADMLLFNKEYPKEIIQFGESLETATKITKTLSKDIVLVDWQYNIKTLDPPTAKYLVENGYKVILAPFDNHENIFNLGGRVIERNYYGFMQTTWHLLRHNINMFSVGALSSWGYTTVESYTYQNVLVYSATNLRKLAPSKGKYKNSGISPLEVNR